MLVGFTLTMEPFLAFCLLVGSGFPLEGELQFGPVGLEGGEICRSLGSINDVNEEVDEVLVLVEVFSVLAALFGAALL